MKKGFTIIEILVSITICVILAMLLVPPLKESMDREKEAKEPVTVNEFGQGVIRIPNYDVEEWIKNHKEVKIISIVGLKNGYVMIQYSVE